MFWLKLFRPKDIPNRKTDWNWRIRFYHWALVSLMPIYKRGAISDVVNVGDLQVIHNVRDYWYEQELLRFRIDTAQHLEKQSSPYNIKRKYHRSCIFNWSESLLVFHDGKSYNVKLGKDYSIATDIEGALKVSSSRDIILRSEFSAKLSGFNKGKNQITKPLRDKQVVDEPKSESSLRRKIEVRDSVPPAHSPEESKTSKFRGFEESDIF
ncbi:MAG: hypothetical protein K5660_07605 [Paludibacteraceae bacterium]|nr:hypothetical protein [Paludibacteraceae bacterium]